MHATVGKQGESHDALLGSMVAEGLALLFWSRTIGVGTRPRSFIGSCQFGRHDYDGRIDFDRSEVCWRPDLDTWAASG
jgi:hypothetical protein